MSFLRSIWKAGRWLLSHGVRATRWLWTAGKSHGRFVWKRIGRPVLDAAADEAAKQAVTLVRDYAQRLSPASCASMSQVVRAVDESVPATLVPASP